MTEPEGPSTPSTPSTVSSTPPRLACLFCRKRKLRCSKQLPQCDSCTKYGFKCEYEQPKDTPRRDAKPGSNASHTKKFEDRLERVESMILQSTMSSKRQRLDYQTPDFSAWTPDGTVVDISHEPEFAEEAVRELEKLFFTFIHPSVNIIHEPTHLRLSHSEPAKRPPDFLRHAMCCMTANASKNYSHLKDFFYQSARRLLQEAEIRDQDFDKVTVAHAQTWIIIAVYELKECFMHRSLMSISRAVRLVQLMRLYRVDKHEKLQDPTLNLIPSPEDWLQAEERRRLFWFTFLMDRYTGISMGWPSLIDTRDVRTLLPVSNEAYHNSTFEPSVFLPQAADWTNQQSLSSFAAQIVGVDLCNTRIQGLTRLETCSNPEDWTGDAWSLSMQMESLLSGIFPIPQQLTIPPAKLTPDNVMLNMGQSSTIIMTHRIAHFQAQANPLSAEFTRKGHEKCQDAAATIVRLMKMTSHWNVHMFHFCTAFCVYTAAVVFGKIWDNNPNDLTSRDSVQFLIDCLNNFRKATRLAGNLLKDIEEEIPGMIGRLNGETPIADIYDKFIDFESAEEIVQQPTPQRMDHIHIRPPEERDPLSSSSAVDGEPTHEVRPVSLPFDATSWTVDDPDIASIGRFM